MTKNKEKGQPKSAMKVTLTLGKIKIIRNYYEQLNIS